MNREVTLGGLKDMDNDRESENYMEETYFASFGTRLLASLIDGLVLFLVIMLLLSVTNHGLLIVISLGIDFLYETLLIYFFGMTIGKKIMKIKVVSNLNKKISLKQAVFRHLFKYLSGFPLCIGYLWMVRNKFNQTWHDLLANTLVIDSKNENEINEYISNNPWKVSYKKRIITICALLLTISIVSYSSLNQLVNKVGNFGIAEFYKQELDGAFLYTKLYDIDKDNDDEIITLSEKNKALSIDVYDWRNNKLEKINSFVLEDKETRMIDWEVGDLDNDEMFEVVVSLEQDNKSEVKVYKRINDSFKSIKSLDYRRDVEIIKDENGKKQLVCYSNGKIVSYSFNNNKFEKNYSGKISTTGLGITKADFDGDNIDELYFIEDKGNGSKKAKCIFIRIDQNGNGIVESKVVGLDLHSNVHDEMLYYREPRNFLIYDMNEDGKDDIILQTRSRLGREAWLNTFTLENGKWVKIYSGGYIDYERRYGIWQMFFLNKGDINGDGIYELIMTDEAKDNYQDERDGKPIKSELFFYKIEPKQFEINGFFQRINSFIQKLIPIL